MLRRALSRDFMMHPLETGSSAVRRCTVKLQLDEYRVSRCTCENAMYSENGEESDLDSDEEWARKSLEEKAACPVRVPVPEGCKAGDKFNVSVYGQKMTYEVPDGCEGTGGEVFKAMPPKYDRAVYQAAKRNARKVVVKIPAGYYTGEGARRKELTFMIPNGKIGGDSMTLTLYDSYDKPSKHKGKKSDHYGVCGVANLWLEFEEANIFEENLWPLSRKLDVNCNLIHQIIKRHSEQYISNCARTSQKIMVEIWIELQDQVLLTQNVIQANLF